MISYSASAMGRWQSHSPMPPLDKCAVGLASDAKRNCFKAPVPGARSHSHQFHHHQTSKNAPRIQSYTTQKGMYQCGVLA